MDSPVFFILASIGKRASANHAHWNIASLRLSIAGQAPTYKITSNLLSSSWDHIHKSLRAAAEMVAKINILNLLYPPAWQKIETRAHWTIASRHYWTKLCFRYDVRTNASLALIDAISLNWSKNKNDRHFFENHWTVTRPFSFLVRQVNA